MTTTLIPHTGTGSRDRDLQKIHEGLCFCDEMARTSRLDFLAPDKDAASVAACEQAIDLYLRQFLPEHDEGWLSEESADDLSRLGRRRVWVVDPMDGTREFTAGIPEWSISIGLVEDGLPVAGGVINPARSEIFLGSVGDGVTLNGKAAPARRHCECISQAVVLASRSEFLRGEWSRFQNAAFRVIPMGSVAYKLARVAAGLVDATWTLVPKHEWDVAGGVALVRAARGMVRSPDGTFPFFNRSEPLFKGLIGFSPSCRQLLQSGSARESGWPCAQEWEESIPLRPSVGG